MRLHQGGYSSQQKPHICWVYLPHIVRELWHFETTVYDLANCCKTGSKVSSRFLFKMAWENWKIVHQLPIHVGKLKNDLWSISELCPCVWKDGGKKEFLPRETKNKKSFCWIKPALTEVIQISSANVSTDQSCLGGWFLHRLSVKKNAVSL